MGIFNNYATGGVGNKLLGNLVDWIGGKAGVPETGISEFIAGGPTLNTGNPVYAAESNPVIDNNYGPQQLIGPLQNPNQTTQTKPTTQQQTQTGGQTSGGTTQVVQQQQPSGPSAEEIARQQYENQVRGDINSGYDSYFANLDAQLGALPGQQDSQNQIVNNSYNQGVGDLNLQQTQGEAQFGAQRGEIAGNQNKNLKSLDENLRNMFMAGNVYLGSRGAGDSSAANQYSYALTKQGNQSRGDQMASATKAYSEVQARETNLKNIVNNEMTKLKTTADNQKLQVGQWFSDAQNQVKTAIANGQLNKSQDLAALSKSILDQAITKLQSVQTNTQNQQNSLITWAESNSKSIGELKTNLQQVLAVAPQLAGQSQINGTPSVDAQGNFSLQGLGSGQTTQKKDIFGNIT